MKGMQTLHYFTLMLGTVRGRILFVNSPQKMGNSSLAMRRRKIIFFYFYSSLLGEAPDGVVTINLEALNIPHHDLADLEAPISEEGVWKAICSLPSDKAPGPDGFTGNFYKVC
jgi:hypothetical protein